MINDKVFTLILLPGIGGHPEFHSYIITELQKIKFLSIKTFTHGDFASKPYNSLSQHTEYWAEKINNELLINQNVGILGISFGTAIVQSLPETTLNKLSCIILLSPIANNFIIKSGIRFLDLFDWMPLYKLFGKFMFWWSLKSAKDKSGLLLLRSKLYDKNEKVYERLWKRFLTLKHLISFKIFLLKKNNIPLLIIFGKNELLYYAFPKPNKHYQNNNRYIVVEGKHSQLINKPKQIINQLKIFINQVNGKNI